MASGAAEQGVKTIGAMGMGAPIIILVILSMVVFPLPPILLDIFFTFNISLSLMILLATIYTRRPLDFAIFPTILLISTLLRLGLNVASTRVVLLNGQNGPEAAGDVIYAFGEVVVGGNYTVGFVVFVILVIINFVVVTKGAGRISEVSARFTLDAMPGKQMAIDADLNAGIIDAETAKIRREEVAREADFYGAMDGASKFVRGDAIAGVLILLVNLIGGVAIGMSEHGMGFGEAMQRYSLMTIGDGLVAQIPSLFLSTASAMIITRVMKSEDVGHQVIRQVFSNPKIFYVTAGVLLLVGIVPGMPHLAFISLAGLLGGLGFLVRQRESIEKKMALEAPEQQQDEPIEVKELSWDDVGQVDKIGLEIGYQLIRMVDKTKEGNLTTRIKGIRKKLSKDLGFLIPSVHIRDNLTLGANQYRLICQGVSVAKAEVHPEMDLAINPGQVSGKLKGIAAKDPAFGLDAVWIDVEQKNRAQVAGYTVVDASTVIATHLSKVIQENAHELLGFEEVQNMLDRLEKAAPQLVETLVPNTLKLGQVVKVFQQLLEEGVPVSDVRTIVESLAHCGAQSQDIDVLTEMTRLALRRSIIQQINDSQEELHIITLDPQLEQILQKSLVSKEGEGVIEPGLADRLRTSIESMLQKQELMGNTAVLVTSPILRLAVSRYLRKSIDGLNVISYQEIPKETQVKVVGTIGQ